LAASSSVWQAMVFTLSRCPSTDGVVLAIRTSGTPNVRLNTASCWAGTTKDPATVHPLGRLGRWSAPAPAAAGPLARAIQNTPRRLRVVVRVMVPPVDAGLLLVLAGLQLGHELLEVVAVAQDPEVVVLPQVSGVPEAGGDGFPQPDHCPVGLGGAGGRVA